jgi:two-component system NarL family sensor kinase
VAIALYRSLQEALQNVIRHADATQVTILLESSEQGIRIEITDDGIGFEPTEASTVGLGMTSMRERMAAIDGSARVRSVPFEGTTIVFSVPAQGVRV